jgi:hypothetical protein
MWRELLAARSPPGLHFAAGAVVDRYWYVFGGQMSDGFGSQETWVLDLSDLSEEVAWVSIQGDTEGPTGRIGHTMCSTPGGLLLFGGLDMQNGGKALLNDLWYFSLPQRVWRLLAAPMEGTVAPLPRAFSLANTVGSHLVVMGGARSTSAAEGGGAILGKSMAYSLDEDMWRWDGKAWRFIGHMRTAVMVGGVSFLPSIGKIILYGGLTGVNSFTSWAMNLRAANALGYDRMYGPAAFEGIATDNVSREVQLLYLDSCNETTDFACLPCSRGHVRHGQPAANVPWMKNDDSCMSCPEGTIQYGVGCLPCPAGFFGPFAGMDDWRMCVPCAEGTATFGPGKGMCVPCGDELGPCPVMSSRPDTVLAPAGVFEQNEPHGSINAMIIHETAQWFNLLYVFCTLVLFILLLFLAHARAPNRIDKCLISLDFRPITGTPPVLPGNPAGGLRIGGVIFICYIAIVSVIFVRAVEKFVTNNSVISSFSVPTEEAVSDSGPLRTDFSVKFTLRGYHGECTVANSTACDSRVALSTEHITVNKSHTTCVRTSSEECSIQWVCHGCTFHSEKGPHSLAPNIKVRASGIPNTPGSHFTAAQQVSVAVRNDWGMLKRSTPAFSALDLTVHAGKGGAVLRGPSPSIVQVSLIPTTFQDTVLNTVRSGYVLRFVDSEVGSTADSARFHEMDPEVSFLLELRTARTTYRLVSAPAKSFFDMAAQLLGILSGMSLIARVVVALLGDGPAQMGCAENCRPACSACTYPCVSLCFVPFARCFCCFLPAEDPVAQRSFFDTEPKNFQALTQQEMSNAGGSPVGTPGSSRNEVERLNGDGERSADGLVSQNGRTLSPRERFSSE